LGKVFHDLIPFNIRKAVAAFYTNNEAAELLAQLSINKPDSTVVDLACGSGTLLVAAYMRKKELMVSNSQTLSSAEHKRFLEHDITGVDIMPFAAHLAVMHLSLQALLQETDKIRIAVWDSTELKPEMSIPAISNELKAAYRKPTLDMFKEKSFVIPEDAHIKKGALTLEGSGREDIPLEKVDLVIMNPPFTRQERLPKEYKESLGRRFSDYSKYSHGQLGLWGYFLFLADKFVKEDGRIAFVLPATTLRVQSAMEVRKLLTDRYTVEHIITAWERAAFSESSQFREILLIARRNVKLKQAFEKNQPDCIVTTLKSIPRDTCIAKQFSDEIKAFSVSNRASIQTKDLSAYKVGQKGLKKLENMFDLIAVENFELVKLWLQIIERCPFKFNIVNKYLASEKGWIRESVRSRKGGSVQSFFILSDKARGIKKKDVWVIEELSNTAITAKHRYFGDKLSIPLRSLDRGLRRPTATMEVTNNLDYIVAKKFDGIKEFSKISIGTDEVSFMSLWQKYVKSRIGKLAIMRRFDISAPGTTLLAFYSSTPFAAGVVMWAVDVPKDEDAKIVTLWLNCSVNILQVLLKRSETRGAFLEIGKYMLDEFSILDSRRLSKSDRVELLNIFEKFKFTIFPSILTQLKEGFNFKVRVEMDEAILKVLGFDENEIEEILKAFTQLWHTRFKN
jgi:methylase of polypeptide subunit release factors